VTGPKRLWDWDVTVLRSSERFVFWYPYSLLDHFSRKAVAWLTPALARARSAGASVDQRLSSDLAQTV
jgi:hypothetical protein